MHGHMENYENRYLEQIKSKGFIKRLKYDAKTNNCAASRRLYTRVKRSFRNRDKWRRRRPMEFLFHDSRNRGLVLTGQGLLRYVNSVGNFTLRENPGNIPIAGDRESNNLLITVGTSGTMSDRQVSRGKVTSWLLRNMQSDFPCQQNIMLDYDVIASLDENGEVGPPSYSFKDQCKPCRQQTRGTGVYHIDMTQDDEFTESTIVESEDLSQYGGNSLNHRIHQCIWCPCVLFFVFLCCIPAILLMTKADKYFLAEDKKEAVWHKKMSTTLYICGFVATILFYLAVALFVGSFV